MAAHVDNDPARGRPRPSPVSNNTEQDKVGRIQYLNNVNNIDRKHLQDATNKHAGERHAKVGRIQYLSSVNNIDRTPSQNAHENRGEAAAPVTNKHADERHAKVGRV